MNQEDDLKGRLDRLIDAKSSEKLRRKILSKAHLEWSQTPCRQPKNSRVLLEVAALFIFSMLTLWGSQALVEQHNMAPKEVQFSYLNNIEGLDHRYLAFVEKVATLQQRRAQTQPFAIFHNQK
jgi:hypothetical protein